MIKKKAVGESEKGVDECGIRDGKVLYNGAQIAAREKTRAVLNYLDLSVVDTRRDKERFDKIKEVLSEDLFQVFDRQEQTQASLWALTWTFLSASFCSLSFTLICRARQGLSVIASAPILSMIRRKIYSTEKKKVGRKTLA